MERSARPRRTWNSASKIQLPPSSSNGTAVYKGRARRSGAVNNKTERLVNTQDEGEKDQISVCLNDNILGMKSFLGVVMALVLVTAQGRKPNHGNCVDQYCVTVHTEAVDFNSAQKSCDDKGGHLVTVRTMAVNSVISDLLTGYTGNFWMGLRYMKDFCAESTQDLKGYTWITGDEATSFTNWKNQERICSQRCVSLSKDDPKWTERYCNHTIEGYLCEYNNIQKCRQLLSQVLYETPFGFAREDLQEVPHGSNATNKHLGTKYICFEGTWMKAPWNCEVYKGGCEHGCRKWNETFICTCPPGYKLESNEVRCSKVQNDPSKLFSRCLQANCSQECVVKGKNYVCQCRNGYELGEDGKTCKDIDKCSNKILCPDENSYCINTTGGFECLCKNGFTKENDTCKDDNECSSAPCEHTCNNTIGSYHCECFKGYKVSSENRHKCTLYCPQWECPAIECDLHKPFQCSCPNGFILEEQLNGNVCTDINECDAQVCDQNCKNIPGGFNCSCEEGFRLVGQTECVKTEELSTTPSIGTIRPTSRSPPSFISVGGILGIILCTLMLILLMVCVIHHCMTRCGKITTDKSHSKDVHALQQVTTEKYVKKQSITNVNYN
ncbi:thrombomodulin [Neoarius graeffei]|uniref:thrombomodulin n=1 Tax=Neoarius graeffei TaxID=443677 RepID=UPI00298CC3C4|nr:thrombomodulin [Neoarius graeffei]